MKNHSWEVERPKKERKRHRHRESKKRKGERDFLILLTFVSDCIFRSRRKLPRILQFLWTIKFWETLRPLIVIVLFQIVFAIAKQSFPLETSTDNKILMNYQILGNVAVTNCNCFVSDCLFRSRSNHFSRKLPWRISGQGGRLSGHRSPRTCGHERKEDWKTC